MAAGKIGRRIAESNAGVARCTIPGCKRQTMRGAGNGLSSTHCRYHVQQKARHGSHWHPSYSAGELRPYLKTATMWLKAHQEDRFVAAALAKLDALLLTSGPVEHYNDLIDMPPAKKAKVALARVREAGIKPLRLLAIHMAMSALIEEDSGSHRVTEFKIVQVAKCVHRLASGTHRRWEMWQLNDKPPVVTELHKYPRPSGRPLRFLGKAIDDACGDATSTHLQAFIGLKRVRFGLHPSQLPGWLPFWHPKRHAAR